MPDHSMSDLKELVFFDIDGTLANIDHRRSFLDQDKPNWKSFNAAMGDDTPNTAITTLYKTLWNSGEYEIVLVTGRTEEYRKLTEQWLSWNEIPFNKIKMRADGDYRADYIIKEEILMSLLGEGRGVLFAVDDRQQVVDMWRRNGIICLQCDEGNF